MFALSYIYKINKYQLYFQIFLLINISFLLISNVGCFSSKRFVVSHPVPDSLVVFYNNTSDIYYEFDGYLYEENAVPLKRFEVSYPEKAYVQGIEGTVWVIVKINEEGKVMKACIMKSQNRIFNSISIAAAEQWEFSPAALNHRPVVSVIVIAFSFRLKDKISESYLP